MNKVKCLSLIVLLILTLIAISLSGCGGDNIATPPSISDESDTSNLSEDYGYITMSVMWPQSNIEGSILISSGDGRPFKTGGKFYAATLSTSSVLWKSGYHF